MGSSSSSRRQDKYAESAAAPPVPSTPGRSPRTCLSPGGVLHLAAGPSLLHIAYDSGFCSVHDDPWELARAQPLRAWPAHDTKPATCVAAAGGLLVTGSRDATLRVWRVDGTAGDAPPTLAGTLAGHALSVAAVDVSPDGSSAVSGSRDCSVRVWDTATAREVAAVHTPQNVVTCCKRVPDGGSGLGGSGGFALVAQGGEDLRVRLWDARGGALVPAGAPLGGYTYFPLALDATPDGAHILTSSKGFNGNGAELREWDLRGGAPGGGGARPRLLRVLEGHGADAGACAFVPARGGLGRGLLASASKDGTVRVWGGECDAAGAHPWACLAVHAEAGANFTSLAVLEGAPTTPGGGVFLAAGTLNSGVHIMRVLPGAGGEGVKLERVVYACAPPSPLLSV